MKQFPYQIHSKNSDIYQSDIPRCRLINLIHLFLWNIEFLNLFIHYLNIKIWKTQILYDSWNAERTRLPPNTPHNHLEVNPAQTEPYQSTNHSCNRACYLNKIVMIPTSIIPIAVKRILEASTISRTKQIKQGPHLSILSKISKWRMNSPCKIYSSALRRPISLGSSNKKLDRSLSKRLILKSHTALSIVPNPIIPSKNAKSNHSLRRTTINKPQMKCSWKNVQSVVENSTFNPIPNIPKSAKKCSWTNASNLAARSNAVNPSRRKWNDLTITDYHLHYKLSNVINYLR